MKTAKFFDVHDEDVTPEIYQLLFSDAIVELTGNDAVYCISYIGAYLNNPEDYIGAYWSERKEKLWEERNSRGWQNCYFDEESMKAYISAPNDGPTSVKNFFHWLKEKGVEQGDDLLVKIWW
jgi:hypothetical protein